ncbi:hypothetical protein [Diaphorobacter caeni]|uniref:hypothetical protein n=1 Tax=Diaphorobacter caeni TaxID=2784387 RepID=UPI00188E9629|nr:hypothetical protein [Diaphorobacter caeni]MBF5005265.1 hypothetical protein [Diaphorobacter caeni]
MKNMLKKWTMAVAMLGMGAGFVGTAQAWGPQTGIWSVTAENSGKPGRGFNIDIQDDTLVMQVYAYERDGTPTFYLTSGKLVDNRYTGKLNKYRGGRFFGSGDLSGLDNGNAGDVRMRFTSGVTASSSSRASLKRRFRDSGSGSTPHRLACAASGCSRASVVRERTTTRWITFRWRWPAMPHRTARVRCIHPTISTRASTLCAA